MANAINRLTARTVTATKAPGLYADGAGLYLVVDAKGRKRWSFIFQHLKKRREMGLGPIHDVSLAEARDARDRARKLVREGINPIDARKRARAADVTFLAAATELRDQLQHGWSNAKHGEQWLNSLKLNAPKLLPMDVGEVALEHVLEALQPIWNEKPETASRVRGRIEQVLDAAKAKGLRTGDNPARWKGHLESLLAKRQRLTRGHHKAMPYQDVPSFLERLKAQRGAAAALLEFVILTAVRSGEARGATWREIQGDVWVIPKERMKARREHRVPLAPAVLEILRHPGLPDALIFTNTGKPLSVMAMDMTLRRMGVEFTVHGFRSSFRDWAGDATHFPRELAEAALAHQVGNAVEQAYRRGDALEKRRALMDAWAKFCTTPPHGAQPEPEGSQP